MDLTFHDCLESFKLDDDDDDEKVEPGELFEDSWFFGNKKANMSTTTISSKSYEEAYESIKKLNVNEPSLMIRAPSMPPRTKDRNDPRRSKSSKNMNLLRAPSLPSNMGITEDDQDDEEIEFSMGKLIRQASLNSSRNLPPKAHAAKGLTPSASLSRHRSRRKPELESVKSGGLEKINEKPKRLMSQLKPQKSLSYLETKELQGFKDLGFDFDNKDLNPNVISIIPGLQEKKTEEDDQETNRPYLSEAWKAQPPVPKWGGKKSADDVKAQIKFWARAVASNVRQEC